MRECMTQAVRRFEGHSFLVLMIFFLNSGHLPTEFEVQDGRMKEGPMFRDLEGWHQQKVLSWLDGDDGGV